MRCPMSASRYTHKSAAKSCPHLATVDVCFPLKSHGDHHEIAFARLCTFHATTIAAYKAKAIAGHIEKENRPEPSALIVPRKNLIF